MVNAAHASCSEGATSHSTTVRDCVGSQPVLPLRRFPVKLVTNPQQSKKDDHRNDLPHRIQRRRCHERKPQAFVARVYSRHVGEATCRVDDDFPVHNAVPMVCTVLAASSHPRTTDV